MRFRLGLVTGLSVGYYLGARAGRQRYDQINRTLARVRRSEAFEQAADQVKTVMEEGVEKARSLVEARAGNGHGDGPMPASSVAQSAAQSTAPPPTPTPTTGTDDAPPGPQGPGGYSSSR